MAKNDVFLLGDMVDKLRQETAGLDKSQQEAYFLAKHYLKEYQPSHDDLLSGICDGTGDGGIDFAYIFVSGFCVRDDERLSGMGKNAPLELIIGQVKNTTGFSEASLDKLIVHLPDLLSFERDEDALSKRFNPKVLEITRRFLTVYRTLDMAELSVYVPIASLRADGPAHDNVLAKADSLAETLRGCFGTCRPTITLLDAADLSAIARDREPTTKQLILAENPISTDLSGGYIGVTTLDEYCKFITDDNGKLDPSMFEANVRDYEVDSDVNRSIQATLEATDGEIDFWWLNNGVTVLARDVQPAGKHLKLSSAQIVNGLQTSYEIYKRSLVGELSSKRTVLVKIVKAADEGIRDEIIKATNSQTTLGTSALRATDGVQRKIEEFLAVKGFYYERRKNFYRNQQIPIDKLVSIDELGQAVVAAVVQLPHIARGNATRVFIDNEIYAAVFNGGNPLEMYSTSISLVRRCQTFLREESGIQQGLVEDFTFHLAMFAAVAATRKRRPNAASVAEITALPSMRQLRELLAIVQEEFAYVATRKGYVLMDQVAKDPMSTQRLAERVQKYLATSAKAE